MIQYSNEACDKWELGIIANKKKLENCGLFPLSDLHIILSNNSPCLCLIPHSPKKFAFLGPLLQLSITSYLFSPQGDRESGKRNINVYHRKNLVENRLNM